MANANVSVLNAREQAFVNMESGEYDARNVLAPAFAIMAGFVRSAAFAVVLHFACMGKGKATAGNAEALPFVHMASEKEQNAKDAFRQMYLPTCAALFVLMCNLVNNKV
jgi:hypothetical protein